MKHIIENNPILYNPKLTVIIGHFLKNTNKVEINRVEREDIDGKYFLISSDC